MHPAFYHWWKTMRRGASCGSHAGCGPDGGGGGWEAASDHGDWSGGYAGGPFGVRRPLRFLAYKLELDERQVGELARILDELKTERAQADVDGRRTITAFADAVAGDTFDDGKAAEGG